MTDPTREFKDRHGSGVLEMMKKAETDLRASEPCGSSTAGFMVESSAMRYTRGGDVPFP